MKVIYCIACLLSVGSVSLFADTLTPAEKSAPANESTMVGEEYDNSPLSQAKERTKKPFPSESHRWAYYSLSPKNQMVYNQLTPKEQNRVAASYEEGQDPQKTIMAILEEDQHRDPSVPVPTDPPIDRTKNAPGVKAVDWETKKAPENANSPASRMSSCQAPKAVVQSTPKKTAPIATKTPKQTTPMVSGESTLPPSIAKTPKKTGPIATKTPKKEPYFYAYPQAGPITPADRMVAKQKSVVAQAPPSNAKTNTQQGPTNQNTPPGAPQKDCSCGGRAMTPAERAQMGQTNAAVKTPTPAERMQQEQQRASNDKIFQ